ncbi:MAG: hypothetical protein ACYC8T_25145 [Myxococcaceae bacterium]
MNRFAFCLCLLPLAGCDPSLEVEIPELCRTFENQAFDPAPVGATATVQHKLDFDLGEDAKGLLGQVDAQAQLLRLELRPRDGMEDVGFVDSASVGLEPPKGSVLPPATVGRYQRGAGAPPAKLSLTADPVDLVPYLSDGTAHLSASISGRLPAKTWHADVEACLSLRARYRYFQ